MDIRVERYSESHRQGWEESVRTSFNGTFLSSRSFLDYHPPERFRDRSLLFYSGSQPFAVIAAAEVDGLHGPELVSHPGATYGGLIFMKRPSAADADQVLGALEQYGVDNRFAAIVLKQAPTAFLEPPTSQTLEFLLPFRGYVPARRDLSTHLELVGIETLDQVLSGCTQKTRNQCRLGEKKGLAFRTTDDVESFHRILSQNLARHGSHPVHTVAELADLAGRLPAETQLYAAYAGDKIAAACWAFRFGKRVFHTQYLAMDYDEQASAPMNFLIAHLILTAAQDGFRYFNFGISTEDGGRAINWGLLRFKESFGGSGLLLTTYRKEFEHGSPS